MQVSKVSAYSLAQVLKANAAGVAVAGFTVRPGFSNGLGLFARQQPAGYVGFRG